MDHLILEHSNNSTKLIAITGHKRTKSIDSIKALPSLVLVSEKTGTFFNVRTTGLEFFVHLDLTLLDSVSLLTFLVI